MRQETTRRRIWSRSFRLGSILLLLTVGSGWECYAAQLPASNLAALDGAIADFWEARTDDEVSAASADILATNATIEEVWPRLRAGRTYDRSAPTGRLLLSRTNRDGLEHEYVVLIPDNYDPANRYPVRVYLHGGVSRPKRENGEFWRNEARITRNDAVVVIPSGWSESLWWQDSQIENLSGILHDLKRTYNLDENKVFLLGISDGATGAYYQGFKATTPWAAFLPLNGHPVVLANPATESDGDIHVTNLRNKPLFVINGDEDPLYPTSSVRPFLSLFDAAGVLIDFRAQPNAGHDTSWWEDEAPAMDAFMAEWSRRPLPPRLSWETETTDRYNRAHWLVIDELGAVEGEPSLESHNTIVDPTQLNLGINMLGVMDGGLKFIEIGGDSIASAAGLQSGDNLIGIEGEFNPSVEDLTQALQGFAPGQQIAILVQRGGEDLEFALVYPEQAAPQSREAFPQSGPSGRVELQQQRNQVTVSTRGVTRFTLLLSPDQFDFTQPVTVVTNGVTVFDDIVEPDVEALLRWAAIDRDRTAMYGAELSIDVEAQQ